MLVSVCFPGIEFMWTLFEVVPEVSGQVVPRSTCTTSTRTHPSQLVPERQVKSYPDMQLNLFQCFFTRCAFKFRLMNFLHFFNKLFLARMASRCQRANIIPLWFFLSSLFWRLISEITERISTKLDCYSKNLVQLQTPLSIYLP